MVYRALTLRPKLTHPWNLSVAEAEALQLSWKQLVRHADAGPDNGTTLRFVAGVDVAYDKDTDAVVAGVALFDMQTQTMVASATACEHCQFPYVPGLFAFREVPAICQAIEKLAHPIDLLICDAQGYAHPRRFGLACHLGVMFDIPSIGCAKTRLIGQYDQLGEKRGAKANLIDTNEIIGVALRTQDGINPLYVSIGHRISLAQSCELVLKLANQYRLPETTRAADHLVNTALVAWKQTGRAIAPKI